MFWLAAGGWACERSSVPRRETIAVLDVPPSRAASEAGVAADAASESDTAWRISLPGRSLWLPLPPGVAGTAQRRGLRERRASAKASSDGTTLLEIVVAREAISRSGADSGETIVLAGTPIALHRVGAGGRVGEFPCEPFACRLELAPDAGPEIISTLANARVGPPVADEEKLSLAGGRLLARARGPVLESLYQFAYESGEPGEHFDHHLVRGPATAPYALAIVSRDTLEPARDPLDRARGRAGGGDRVDELAAPDAALRVARILWDGPAGPQGWIPSLDRIADEPLVVVATLFVAEQGGTTLEVEFVCDGGAACRADRVQATADLAATLARGKPLATGGPWRVTLGPHAFEMDLPADYLAVSWFGEDHGDYGHVARRIGEPAAEVAFEYAGDAPGVRGAASENLGPLIPGREVVVLGGRRVVLQARRSPPHGRTAYVGELPCPESICLVRVTTDDANERRRLQDVLRSARTLSAGAPSRHSSMAAEESSTETAGSDAAEVP